MIKGILVVVAIVIAIEGGFISWSLYDSRDGVRVAQQELSEIKVHVSDLDMYSKATNEFLVEFDKELVAIRRSVKDIDGNTDSLERYADAIESIRARLA
jgi:hypothetical protein